MRILVVGAGGHAQVIADLILSRARLGEDIRLVGFLDDNPSLIGTEILGAKVLGTTAQLDKFMVDAAVIGVGDNSARARQYERLTQIGAQSVALIHPRAIVAADVRIGDGTVVFAGAVINTGSIIDANVIVNTGATLDHHARVGAHAHLAPGVHLGGNVIVGAGAFIGIGSNVVPNLKIGEWAIIGAGAAVTEDVPPRVKAVGVPARVI